MTKALGYGQTTAGPQTAATFLDAGWNSMGETANGTETSGGFSKDYPRLWWEPMSENCLRNFLPPVISRY